MQTNCEHCNGTAGYYDVHSEWHDCAACKSKAIMKRIDRLTRAARHEAGMALVFFFAGMAAGVWAVVAAQWGTPGGGFLIAAAATAVLFCGIHLRECVRVARLAMREMEWEVGR